MKLCLKNIAKIEDAEIEINGITVIGGENDTGKSTVGKALFSVFSSFFEIQHQIYKERFLSIENIVRIIDSYPIALSTDPFKEYNAFVDEILSNAEKYIKTPELLEKHILDLVLDPNNPLDSLFMEKTLGRIKEKNYVGQIIEILKIPDEVILNSIIKKRLNAEFSGQFLNIDSQTKGNISLQVQNEELSIKISEDFVSVSGLEYSLHTEAIYIDDPFLLDKISFRTPRKKIVYADHQEHLINRFLSERFYTTAIDAIVSESKFKKIFEKLTSVCEGKLIRQKNGLLAFQRKNSDTALRVNNLSTGLKTFVILKTLLENGVIEQNGTIILDEPEIHLHPEWQLLFAEIIVLLNMEFGVNILLNTHSPYFLRAIQVYSAKYERSGVCKYYLSELDKKGKAYITDVTDNVDQIFAKLAEPLQALEDEMWKIEN